MVVPDFIVAVREADRTCPKNGIGRGKDEPNIRRHHDLLVDKSYEHDRPQTQRDLPVRLSPVVMYCISEVCLCHTCLKFFLLTHKVSFATFPNENKLSHSI